MLTRCKNGSKGDQQHFGGTSGLGKGENGSEGEAEKDTSTQNRAEEFGDHRCYPHTAEWKDDTEEEDVDSCGELKSKHALRNLTKIVTWNVRGLNQLHLAKCTSLTKHSVTWKSMWQGYRRSSAWRGAGDFVSEGNCVQEIQTRLKKALGITTGLQKISKSRTIAIRTKLWLLKALAWPVATYGCESWTLRKADRQRIEAFELKTYRRLLRVPWTAKRTNKSVLQEPGVDRQLLKSVTERKLRYFRHIMRRPGDCLEKAIIQGCIEGSRPRGRPAKIWINDILETTNCPLDELLRLTEDRTTWRQMVHSASNHRN